MYDGIHTLAYDHEEIIMKVVRIWKGPDMFFISAEEEKSKDPHLSGRIDSDTIKTRAPMKSVWQAGTKHAFAKNRKRLK